MKVEEYREFLQDQGTSDDAIEGRLAIIRGFVEFLGPQESILSAEKDDVDGFARKLIAEERNTLESFLFLRDYADWLGQRKLHVALIEVMDCYNALDVLANEVETRHGRGIRERLFREPLPPLGAGEKERCAYTRAIMESMAQLLSHEERRTAWFQVQHGIPADVWRKIDIENKWKYQQSKDIDKFLDLKRQERDTLLTRLRDEDQLWYTVTINDEVLEFVKSDPEMEVGRREGNRIYISKIPYNAVRYLHEAEPRMKRYYACHCPLLREAILESRPISPDVCNCSLGHASHYLAGLGLDLKGEVLESAVKGDIRCRFVFYLPDKYDAC